MLRVNAVAPARGFTAKHALFAVIALMALYVLFNNERFILDHADPQWKYYFPVRWLLVPHGLAGLVVLALGATQFSTRLRAARPRIHRVCGRCYVIGVALAAPVAMVISELHNGLPTRIAIFVQAGAWLLTTGIAFVAIRRRNFVQHREWMIRSYAVTLIFLTDRVLDAVPGFADFDGDASPTILWICNLVAWVVPTVIIAWPSLVSPPRDFPRTSTPPR